MDPSVNLSDLAVEMGYSDQSHFIKEFKRFQKMTPVEFLSQFPGR
jgi:AraC-like DNA-binding protein